jgi:hypothetical protein
MNFYQLSAFEPVSIHTLLKLFVDGETIKSCAISVYGDTVGKPGDTVYSLHGISLIDDSLFFDLGKTSLTVSGSSGIIVNEKIIGIKKCSKVIWTQGRTSLIYQIQNDELLTSGGTGGHVFHADKDEDALLLYVW